MRRWREWTLEGGGGRGAGRAEEVKRGSAAPAAVDCHHHHHHRHHQQQQHRHQHHPRQLPLPPMLQPPSRGPTKPWTAIEAMDGAKERADATRVRPMVMIKQEFAAAMEITQETLCAQHALAPPVCGVVLSEHDQNASASSVQRLVALRRFRWLRRSSNATPRCLRCEWFMLCHTG